MVGLTPEAMLRQKRVSSLVASRDGQALAFAVRQFDWDASRWTSQIWVHDRRTGANRVLAASSAGNYSDSSPSWMDDSETIVFLSDRGGKGNQLWQIRLDEGKPSQLTQLSLPIDSYRLNHAIGAIIFSTKVVPCDDNQFAATLEADKKNEQQQGRFMKYDRLFVRRWDDWNDGKISKLFLLFLTRFGRKYAAVGCEQYLMSHSHPYEECPVPPFGDSSHYDISPDGKEIVYCSHEYPNDSTQAWSTFVSLKTISIEVEANFVVSVQKSEKIPSDSEGCCSNPVYSSDGKYIAFLSMKRAGYESDWNRVAIFDRAENRVKYLTDVPVSPSELVWSPKCDSVFVAGNHQARKNVYKVPLSSRFPHVLMLPGEEIHGIAALQSDGEPVVAYLKNSAIYPDRVYIGTDCVADPNAVEMEGVDLSRLEQVWFEGANSDKVHSWLMKPCGFDANRKWPLVMIIHGGPQGCITDSWHYRWNLGIFASAGYAVLAVNFHGSTGFGQPFCDSIQGDWGGKPFQDLMRGLDHAIKQHDWIDPHRVGALGASYGGYMINWINGHTSRFKCLVNHDGLFNSEAMYYTTEEIYFMEHDFQGTPWSSSKYREFSPHLFVDKWATPTLVVHGGKDYRVVDCEGLATFTALQRRGIPSEFLYFPSEGHWVLNPHNSLAWHVNVLQWLQRWLQ